MDNVKQELTVQEIVDQAAQSPDRTVRQKAEAYRAWSAAGRALDEAQAALATALAQGDEHARAINALKATLASTRVGHEARIAYRTQQITEAQADVASAQQAIANAEQEIVKAEQARAAYLIELERAVVEAAEKEQAAFERTGA
jgi:chromosome segregation ATPase